jgi:hypothetical protein
MPDFHLLSEQLRADLSRVDWSPGTDVRAAGARRRRRQTLVVTAVSAAVVVVITSVALLSPGGQPTSAPVGSPGPLSNSPSAVPTPTASPLTTSPGAATPTSAPGVSQGVTLPNRMLLDASDVSPDFAGVDVPFAGLYSPNPFIGCGPDGLVGPAPVGVTGAGFTHGEGNSVRLGGESVLWYGTSASATQAMSAIRQLMAGVCATGFQVSTGILGGDELILFSSTQGDIVVPQAAHGAAIYHAVVRHRAYLIWITIVDEYQTSDGKSLATTLAQRAMNRLCSATTC